MKVRKTIVGSQIGVQPPGGEDRLHPSPTSLSTCLEVSERLKSFSRPRLHSSQDSALTLLLLSHANMPTCCYISPLCNWDTTQKRLPLSCFTLFERGVLLLALLACVQRRVEACRWGIRCWRALGISYPDGSTGLERSHVSFLQQQNAVRMPGLELFCIFTLPLKLLSIVINKKIFRLETT